jgi:uncharacterized Zn-binding protein involved in type VI secretion
MPAIAFHGCTCSGHGCWPPRKNDQASPNTFVNNKGIHRKGDHWVTHCCISCHDGFLVKASKTVFVNNVGIGRIGDQISCGSVIAEG